MMEKSERGSRKGAVCSSVVTVHDACVHAESTPLCCQGQNQCCNLVKCSYPSIRLKGVQFYQVFIWGIAKAQRTSDDVKLSEPGGVPTSQVPSQEICPTFPSLAKDLEPVMETLK